jgi:hypothetical protein
MSNGWYDDIRNASNFFVPLLGSDEVGVWNTALMGATPAQLRGWGYDVNRVPSIDSRLDTCGSQVGDLQLRCWAELDAYLMEKVVPFAPLFTRRSVGIVSARVLRRSYDASNFSVPALDRFVVSEREP